MISKLAVLALACAIFANAYGMTFIFSFVGLFVVDIGAAQSKDQAGYYAGYILSAFMGGRALSSVCWGAISDRYGRRVVVLSGLVSVIVSSFLFGVTRSFPVAVLLRATGGLLNGIIAAAKTLASELCSEEEQPFCMGLVNGMWSVGLIMGPAMSGWLSYPAKNYPTLFDQHGFFATHPFMLPCVVASIVGAVALVTNALFLVETAGPNAQVGKTEYQRLNTTDEDDDDIGDQPNYVPGGLEVVIGRDRKGVTSGDKRSATGVDMNVVIDPADDATSPIDKIKSGKDTTPSLVGNPDPPLGEPLITKDVLMAISFYCLVSFNCIVFDEVIPLWALSSTKVGGLEYNVDHIGTFLAIGGCIMFVFQFTIYPYIAKCFSPTRLLSAAFFLSGLSGLLLPFVADQVVGDRTSRNGSVVVIKVDEDVAHHQETVLWVALLLTNGVRVCTQVLGFTNVSIVCNNATVKANRGRMNGLAMALASIFKMLGPAVGGTVYAWSVKPDSPMDFHFTFVGTGFLHMGVATMCLLLLPDRFNHNRDNLPKTKAVEMMNGAGKVAPVA